MSFYYAIYPALDIAIEGGLPPADVQVAAQVLMDVARIPVNRFKAELGERKEDAAEMNEPEFKKRVSVLQKMSRWIKLRRC